MRAAGSTTVAAALAQARSSGVERLDAQLLLAALCGRSRTWLIARDDALLSAEVESRWTDCLARRAAGVPLAYLLGEKEFHGLTLEVNDAVLVPRPDTETLVDWALSLPLDPETGSFSGVASGHDRKTLSLSAGPRALTPTPPAVIDLGTGSGAIALALKRARPAWQLTAVDASDAALAVARCNAARHRLTLQWLRTDWWAGLGPRQFDLAVSNPPYLADDDPHLPALFAEPLMALTAGPDGLDALRTLIADAPQHLSPGAWLLLEHGHDQHAAVAKLLVDAGFGSVESRSDLAGHVRCTGGRMPGGDA